MNVLARLGRVAPALAGHCGVGGRKQHFRRPVRHRHAPLTGATLHRSRSVRKVQPCAMHLNARPGGMETLSSADYFGVAGQPRNHQAADADPAGTGNPQLNVGGRNG